MLRASQGDDLDQRCEGQVQGQEGEERVERLEVVAECEEVEYGDHVDNKPRPDYELVFHRRLRCRRRRRLL